MLRSRGNRLRAHAGKPDLQEGGPPLHGTEQRPTSASYRDAVTELIESGAPFGDVEDAIDELPCLTTDDKAALWLLAFSLRDPGGHELDARTPRSCVLAPGRAT